MTSNQLKFVMRGWCKTPEAEDEVDSYANLSDLAAELTAAMHTDSAHFDLLFNYLYGYIDAYNEPDESPFLHLNADLTHKELLELVITAEASA